MLNSFASTTPPCHLISGWKRRNSIGIISPSYGMEKVSYGLTPSGYSFHKVLRLPVHRFEKKGTYLAHTPIVLDHPVELIHTFNDVTIGLRPFVVSFENELPRYLGDASQAEFERGYRLLASDRCRAILALSEAASSAMRVRLRAHGIESLMNKVSVFRGSVLSIPIVEENTRAESREGDLKLLFVGRDAFGKGLLPTLDALDECHSRGVIVKATIVCNFEQRDYISKGYPIDGAQLVERMQRMPGVTYCDGLPNIEVHKLMHSHDVLAFPTLDESLGWVAIEASLAGMPIISTDIFAIPELVQDGITGVLIPLKKNVLTRWVGLWLEGEEFRKEVEKTFLTIRNHMVNALVNFADNPKLVASMGTAAKAHIESLYEHTYAQRQLVGIYAKALGR